MKVPVQVAPKASHMPAASQSRDLVSDRQWERNAQQYMGFGLHSLVQMGSEGASTVLEELCKHAPMSPPIRALSSQPISPANANPSTNNFVATPNAEKTQTLHKYTPATVNSKTGFEDLVQLLSFAAVVSGGNLELLCSTVTKLSFVEEWLLYAEWAYGRSRNHFKDLAEDYELCENTSRRVVYKKLQQIL